MNIYVYGAKRTPLGAFQGQLSRYHGWQLGAEALHSLTPLTKISPQDVFMGCVLGAGQGQAPARQAVMTAFPEDGKSIAATTINKVCGSGMQAIMFACDRIRLNDCAVAMAGGFESMSNAPYLLPKARGGYRMGHGIVYDHINRPPLSRPLSS